MENKNLILILILFLVIFSLKKKELFSSPDSDEITLADVTEFTNILFKKEIKFY